MSKAKIIKQIESMKLPIKESENDTDLQLYLFKDGKYEACYDPVTEVEILENSINIKTGYYGISGTELVSNHSYDSFDHIEILPRNWLDGKGLHFTYDYATQPLKGDDK